MLTQTLPTGKLSSPSATRTSATLAHREPQRATGELFITSTKAQRRHAPRGSRTGLTSNPSHPARTNHTVRDETEQTDSKRERHAAALRPPIAPPHLCTGRQGRRQHHKHNKHTQLKHKPAAKIIRRIDKRQTQTHTAQNTNRLRKSSSRRSQAKSHWQTGPKTTTTNTTNTHSSKHNVW